MASSKKMLCPLMQRECVEDGAVVNGALTACRFWTRVQGKHPQSGETLDHYDCSISWIPILLIENSKVNRETGAAVESLRNSVVDSNESTRQSIIQTVLGGQPRPAIKHYDTEG